MKKQLPTFLKRDHIISPEVSDSGVDSCLTLELLFRGFCHLGEDTEATKACSQANAGIQNAGSQPAREASQHPTSTPLSPKQAAVSWWHDWVKLFEGVLWCGGLGCGLFGVTFLSHGGACDGLSLLNLP